MNEALYTGSVKNIYPLSASGLASIQSGGLVFEFSDSFSVFDWGRMPDELPQKGRALATLAAFLFEQLETPESWRAFSRSPGALALRKANRFGVLFNEMGEELQSSGLRTHYIGVISDQNSSIGPLDPQGTPIRKMVVRPVAVTRPRFSSLLGLSVPDYSFTRASVAPRLIPLEVIFRFGCPSGSSLLERVAQNPHYLHQLGFGHLKAEPGAQWDFPMVELFTKLEPTDRCVSYSEALSMSGLSVDQLQRILLKTVWIAGWLQAQFQVKGLELADGKLEWALDGHGHSFLVDAIGPDELRIQKEGVSLSKEFLRSYYRQSSWYQAIQKAKSSFPPGADWKRVIQEQPPVLPSRLRELASEIYQSLTNTIVGGKGFAGIRTIDQLVRELRK